MLTFQISWKASAWLWLGHMSVLCPIGGKGHWVHFWPDHIILATPVVTVTRSPPEPHGTGKGHGPDGEWVLGRQRQLMPSTVIRQRRAHQN